MDRLLKTFHRCSRKWPLTSLCRRLNAILLYPPGFFGSQWPIHDDIRLPVVPFNERHDPNIAEPTQNWFNLVFLLQKSTSLVASFAFYKCKSKRKFTVIYISRMVVLLMFVLFLELHFRIFEATSPWRSHLYTWAIRMHDGRTSWRWQLWVASWKQNGADIDIYRTIYGHIPKHGSYLCCSTKAVRCQEAFRKVFFRGKCPASKQKETSLNLIELSIHWWFHLRETTSPAHTTSNPCARVDLLGPMSHEIP